MCHLWLHKWPMTALQLWQCMWLGNAIMGNVDVTSVYITNVVVGDIRGLLTSIIHIHVNMLECMCVSHCFSCTPYLSQALTSASHVKLGSMAVAWWWWDACRTQWMGVYPRLLVLGNGHDLAHWATQRAALVGWQLVVLEQAHIWMGYSPGCDICWGGPQDDCRLDGSSYSSHESVIALEFVSQCCVQTIGISSGFLPKKSQSKHIYNNIILCISNMTYATQ